MIDYKLEHVLTFTGPLRLVAFADVVPIPVRNQHGHIAFHHGLAAEARMQLEVGRLFHAVHLVIVHFGEVISARFHHHVTSGAGATSATGMFEMKAEVHGDIE